ncbi:hypothetical protein H2248_009428 [Termitomyces sp. 'cryptogamus']|nr:hypothetical protein H2248_009428 [Termitomyces sp. 'cryptogamus']
MLQFSPAPSNAGLPTPSIWDKLKGKGKDVEMRDRQALARQRLLTLAFGDMETLRLVTLYLCLIFLASHTPHSSPTPLPFVASPPSCYLFIHLHIQELEAAARDWTKPPPDAPFTLRVPVEFASIHAARLVAGPYIYLTGEDSYQIALMGVQGLRVEIVSDVPPPPNEPPPPP